MQGSVGDDDDGRRAPVLASSASPRPSSPSSSSSASSSSSSASAVSSLPRPPPSPPRREEEAGSQPLSNEAAAARAATSSSYSSLQLMQSLRRRGSQAVTHGREDDGEREGEGEEKRGRRTPSGSHKKPATPYTTAAARANADGESLVDMPPLELKTRGRKDLRGPVQEELKLSCCTGRSRDRVGTLPFHALHLAIGAAFGGAAALAYQFGREDGVEEVAGVPPWRYLAFCGFVVGVVYVSVIVESLLVAAAGSSTLDHSAPWPFVLFAKAVASSSANLFAAAVVSAWWGDLLPHEDSDSRWWPVFGNVMDVWLFVAATNAVRRWLAARAVFKFNMEAHLERINKLNARARLINDLCERDGSRVPEQMPVNANGEPVVSVGLFARVLRRLRRSGRGTHRNRFELRTGKRLMGTAASNSMYEVGAPPPPEALQRTGSAPRLRARRGLSPRRLRRLRRPRRSHGRSSGSGGGGGGGCDEKDAGAGQAAPGWKPADAGAAADAAAAAAAPLAEPAPAVDLTVAGHVQRTADLIMKRLDPSERGYFVIADLEDIYVSSVAMDALAFFEVIPDGQVERVEVVQTLHKFFRDRRLLRQNILAYQQLTPAIRSFFRAVHWAVLAVAVPVLFGLQVERTLLLFGTLLVSVSFAVGGSIRDVIDSYVFLVYRRPFVVGDRIQLNVDGKKPATMKFWVDSISLLSTTLRGWDNGHNQISNAVLARFMVKNLSRSHNAEIEILVELPFSTPVSVLKRLAAAVLEHTRRNRAAWTPIVDTYIYALDRTRGLTLSVWLISNLPLSNSRGLLINATAVSNVIRMFLTSNKVSFVDTELPVRIVQDDGEAAELRAQGRPLSAMM